MCGIVAAAAANNIVPVLIEGLKKLEYRGYDSAGLAVIGLDAIERVRLTGRMAELETAAAVTVIAYRCWMMYSVLSERNAQPHISDNIGVVQNGIIDNHEKSCDRVISSPALIMAFLKNGWQRAVDIKGLGESLRKIFMGNICSP
jgi:glucosamine 6-phosphate synthetase-like amidotransferase/phosphosugar isomerase protein